MATGPQFVEALAPVCGMHPATFDRYLRELRKAGLIPASGKGGGIAAAHLDHNHAASIILSMAAMSPAGAADAVRRVASLDREHLRAGDAGLWTGLAISIATAATTIHFGGKPYGPDETYKWELTICLDPVMAWMTWTRNGKETREDYSDRQAALPRPAHPQDVHRGIRRLTVITTAVLNVAAVLCADTITRTGIKQPSLVSIDKTPSQPDAADLVSAEAMAFTP